MTTKKLAEELDVTKRTVLREIKNLNEQKKLKRKGGTRSGWWEVVTKEE